MNRVKLSPDERLDQPDAEKLVAMVETHLLSFWEVLFGGGGAPGWQQTGCTRNVALSGATAVKTISWNGGLFIDAARKSCRPPGAVRDFTGYPGAPATLWARVVSLDVEVDDRVVIFNGVEFIDSIPTEHGDDLEYQITTGAAPVGDGWAQVLTVLTWNGTSPVLQSVNFLWNAPVGDNLTQKPGVADGVGAYGEFTLSRLLVKILDTIKQTKWGGAGVVKQWYEANDRTIQELHTALDGTDATVEAHDLQIQDVEQSFYAHADEDPSLTLPSTGQPTGYGKEFHAKTGLSFSVALGGAAEIHWAFGGSLGVTTNGPGDYSLVLPAGLVPATLRPVFVQRWRGPTYTPGALGQPTELVLEASVWRVKVYSSDTYPAPVHPLPEVVMTVLFL